MKRYKYTKLLKLGPVDGFLIHTPDDRKLKDTHPQTIVRELNRLNDEIEEKRKDIVYLATEKAKLEERIKRLEEALDMLTCVIGLTPIKGNLAALQEAFDMAHAVLKAKENKL